MNRVALSFIGISVVLTVLGLYLIYPPLAVVSAGLIFAGIGVLFWEVDEE